MFADKDPLRDVEVPVDGFAESGFCFVDCIEWIAIEGEPVKKNQPIARFVHSPGKRFRGGDILILAPESGFLQKQIQKTGQVVKFSGGIGRIGTIRSNTHLIASEWHIPYEQPAYDILQEYLDQWGMRWVIIWFICLLLLFAWEVACLIGIVLAFSNYGIFWGIVALIGGLVLGLLGLGIFLLFSAGSGPPCEPWHLKNDKQHHKEKYIRGSKAFYSDKYW